MSALFDCHGNWSAAVALMDRACLPRPPLTLTRVMQVRVLAVAPVAEVTRVVSCKHVRHCTRSH